MPEILYKALMAQAYPFKNEQENQGGVKEYCCNTEGQAHYPPCQTSTSAPKASSWDGTQVCGKRTANNANGAQRMPDKDNFNAVVQETVGAICANVYIKNTHQDVAQGLYITQKAYGQSSFGQYKEGPGTLKANGGDIGGGSETLVIQ